MDFRTNGVYMGFLQKILCILTALAIYPATIVIPKQDNFDRQIIFPHERRVFEIKQYESYAERNKQISCLQKNVYFEAAVESTAGKLAVAHVTYNRVRNKYFPDNFCDVVYQGRHYASGHPKKNQCQFSWYCDGKSDSIPLPDAALFETVRAMAVKVAAGFFGDLTDGATHYHAYYVRPDWAVTKTPTVRIDAHIFYRWEK